MDDPKLIDGPAAESRGEAPGDSLRSYLKRGEEFIDLLLHENERLRVRVLQLETKLQEHEAHVPAPMVATELRAIFEKLNQEHEQLRRKLDAIAQETEQYKERYHEIEEENDRLVNLFVATHQLHSTVDFPGVVQIIVEILLNFVGAGRFAIFALDTERDELEPIEAYGVPLAQVPVLSLHDPAIEACLGASTPLVNPVPQEPWDVSRPVVWIPLKVPETYFGIVAIYSYLTQKDEVSLIDRELFTLLGEHAGTVLETARILATKTQQPRSADALRALLKAE
jgi:hypothetical protein